MIFISYWTVLLLLSDSSILIQVIFFLADKLLKIEKIEKVKILHWYINRVHLWHPSTQIPLVHDHMIFQM